MKVYTAGSRFWGGQVDRVDAGFTLLGHDLTTDPREADLLYSNDPGGYKEILASHYACDLKKGARIIFNVLDIPEHLMPNYDLEGLERMLNHAHAVTSISLFVQDQLIRHLMQGSTVIYQPIKPVLKLTNMERLGRESHYLSAGRRQDPNKRFRMAVAAHQKLGVNYNNQALVGSDYSPWGHHFGVLTDEQLNFVYNVSDFVIATGLVEGLNLPVLVGMAAGVIPVVCADMTTRKELLPLHLVPEYEDVHPTAISVSRFIARYLQDNDAMQQMKDRLHAHYLKVWKDRVSPAGVAKAILDVYEGVKP